MGLWNFVKTAGKALGIGEAEAAEAPAPEALKKEVEDLGLKADGLEIAVDGDTVRVTGRAPSQEEKEKLILAVGNVAGVAKVEEALEIARAGGGAGVPHGGEGRHALEDRREDAGQGRALSEIFEANRPMLSDPDKIYPGQVLRIPAK